MKGSNTIIGKTDINLFNKDHAEMIKFLNTLDKKNNKVWDDELSSQLGWHITWWHVPTNTTLHFYYDKNGKKED